MLVDRVAALDISLFDQIETQATDDDRRSLLALHNAVAMRHESFSYLEIGSYLGGSLQAFIADPRCKRVVSIDPRPLSPPDDRLRSPTFEYPGNSTARMLELLRLVPGADISKLETIEASTETIAPERVTRPDLCLIDGEHTYRAALRDARFCREATFGRGVIAFHDFDIVGPAALEFLRETPRPRRGYLLSSCVFVVELGTRPSLIDDPGIRRQLRPRHRWMARRAAATAKRRVVSRFRHGQR